MPEATKYEFKVVTFSDKTDYATITKMLDDYGERGWHVVSVSANGDKFHFALLERVLQSNEHHI